MGIVTGMSCVVLIVFPQLGHVKKNLAIMPKNYTRTAATFSGILFLC
jgi:hypothetical protein